jgi:hypothetical protein
MDGRIKSGHDAVGEIAAELKVIPSADPPIKVNKGFKLPPAV